MPETALDPEDAKLVTLARAARARAGAPAAAALRDDIGRTYVAAEVGLPSLRLSALQAVVATAVSSGTLRFEAAVVVSEATAVSADDERLLVDVGAPRLLLAGPDGTVRSSV